MSEAHDLAAVLRAWRARVQPQDVGLSFGRDSRRTPGLRREEVAWLAGVSSDYVKRLEQGRAHPSAPVLRALCRTLRVSPAEYELACRLAGHAAELRGQVPQLVSPGVQRLLDRLSDNPIGVFDAGWTLLERNELWAALMGAEREPRARSANLVWRFFHDDTGRVRHRFPEEYRRSIVSDLRDAASRYPHDKGLVDMIHALRATNAEFARIWEKSSVARHTEQRKTIDHPVVGELELDCDVLSVHGADLRIIVFSAGRGSEASRKLQLLTVVGTENMTAAEAGRVP